MGKKKPKTLLVNVIYLTHRLRALKKSPDLKTKKDVISSIIEELTVAAARQTYLDFPEKMKEGDA